MYTASTRPPLQRAFTRSTEVGALGYAITIRPSSWRPTAAPDDAVGGTRLGESVQRADGPRVS
ncbi:hypothetical protein E2C01_069594 [Portunus trituberculatus]|uniref:Uncharacterized protein n=1 Tax=Portunus trituberculatus TaxID=210409 RepID=A0A5B7HRZ1_PORTR|nr:hypothetical protein [Portunus trituberculatus]